MSITEKQLRDLIEKEADIEKVSSISSDGKNLLTRIPKKVREKTKMKKGDKLIWRIRGNEISLKVQNAKEEN